MKKYLEEAELDQLFRKLGVADPDALAKTVQHFASKEAKERDKIVKNYFGESNITQIVESVTDSLLTGSKLPANAKVLDLGAGSGFFTAKIAERIRSEVPEAAFYAMDITPAMLLSLAKKGTRILPFIGLAEDAKGSIQEARRYFKIPLKFDAVFSTLMLHHSARPEKVFESISRILKSSGKAVVVDLCEHTFEEFKTEMGDLHLGFRIRDIWQMADRYFQNVEVKKMQGIRCSCSGRSAEIFLAIMQNH